MEVLDTPTQAEIGQPFEITVRMRDVQEGGPHGGISVSFPDLMEDGGEEDGYSSDLADLEWVATALDGSEAVSNVKFYQPGEGLIHPWDRGDPFEAEYLLVESDEPWAPGDDRSLTLRITPKQEGEFRILVRGWICADTGEDGRYEDCTGQPTSGTRDQQGWPAEERIVNVASEVLANWIFPADFTESQKNAYRELYADIHRFAEQQYGYSVGFTPDIIVGPVVEACGRAHTINLISDPADFPIRIDPKCADPSGLPRRTMAHEYFHVIQSLPTGTPLWMTEGSAVYFASRYLQAAGMKTYLSSRNAAKLNLKHTALGALQDIVVESMQAYDLSFLAMDYLAHIAGDANAPVNYFNPQKRSGGVLGVQNWKSQFEMIFGIEVEDFYSDFGRHRASGFPTLEQLPTHIGDRNTLVNIYSATNGNNWADRTNWLDDDVPLNDWYGVTTNEIGRVTELLLTTNNLTGEIPVELSNLFDLRDLQLTGNQLTGEIPAELGGLSNLWELQLADNQLTGEIPAELGGLSNLWELMLFDNQLTGEIPVELGSLSNLRGLMLFDNQLTGEIPVELGNLTNLQYLLINENEFTGTLPRSLTNLSNMKGLHFNDNVGLCAPADEAFQKWMAAATSVNGPNCSAQSFTLDSNASDGSIEVGERFTLTVRMHDVQAAGRHGGISVSFPQLIWDGGGERSHSSSIADVALSSAASSVSNVKFFQPGEGRIHRASDDKAITARHLLVESDEPWREGDERVMTLEITPKREGVFQMLVRGWICAGVNVYGVYTDCARQPDSGSVVDQQGSPVEVLTVTVTPGVSQTAPDLVVDSQGASDRELEPGERFTMSFQVRNQGDARSTTSASLRYYRSANATITPNDTEINIEPRTISVGPLDPSRSTEVTIDLNALSSGRYYYGACVGTVPGESNTRNNCTAVLRVTVSEPDLVVVSPSVKKSEVDAGDGFEFSATVRNVGGRRASDTTLRYYRSSDAIITTKDVRVFGRAGEDYDSVPVLVAGEHSDVSIDLTAPDDADTYYYGACVRAVSGESKTSNNCSLGVAVTVDSDIQGTPDLVPARPKFSDYTPERGSSVRVWVTIQNVGNKQADETTLQLWSSSSRETVCTGFLAWETSVEAIDADSERTKTLVNLSVRYAGTYFYRVKVLEVDGELETDNNCSTPTVMIVE